MKDSEEYEGIGKDMGKEKGEQVGELRRQKQGQGV